MKSKGREQSSRWAGGGSFSLVRALELHLGLAQGGPELDGHEGHAFLVRRDGVHLEGVAGRERER